MGSESADPTDREAVFDWQDAVRELFASPVQLMKDPPSSRAVNGKTRRSHKDRHLPDALRELLEANRHECGGAITWGALYQLLQRALDHGDDTDLAHGAGKGVDSAKASREGARGTLFLASRDSAAVPTTPEEIELVNATRDPIGQARRWATIRAARAAGREGRISKLFTPATARAQGTARAGEFAAQLVDDLAAYLSARPGLRLVEQELGADITQGTATDIALGLEELAVAIDAPSPTYPNHMVPSFLAASFPLTARPHRGPNAPKSESTVSTVADSTLEGALRRYRRIVVLAPPGGGKSTMLKAEVIERLRAGKPALYARLPQIALAMNDAQVPTSLDGAVEILIRACLQEFGIDPQAVFETFSVPLSRNSDSLIALDGLDEIDASVRVRLSVLLRHLDRLPGRVVLSSRPIGYSSPAGSWREIDVNPMPEEHARKFIESWFDGSSEISRSRAERAVQALHLTDARRLPVVLGMIATVARKEEVAPSPGLLYEQYVSIALQRMWRPSDQQVTKVDELRRRHCTAAQIAWISASGGALKPDVQAWSESVSMSDLQRSTLDVDMEVAHDLFANDALLHPQHLDVSIQHQQYEWNHRTLQEHLVGAHFAALRSHDRTAWRALFPQLILGSAPWFEPIKHMAEILNPADRGELLEEVVELDPSLDPDGIVSFLFDELVQVWPEDSRARQEAARYRIGRGNFQFARILDRHAFWEAWCRSLFLNPTHVPFDIARVIPELKPDSFFELIRRFRKAPVFNQHIYAELLDAASELDPNEAMRLYLRELRATYPGHDAFPRPIRLSRVSTEVTRETVEVARTVGPQTRVRLIRSLIEAGGEFLLDPHLQLLLEPVDCAMAAYINRKNRNEPASNDPTTVEALRMAAKGHYGQDHAFYFGRDKPSHFFRVDGTMPYAFLGRVVQDLLDGSVPPLSGYECSKFVDMLETVTVRDLEDPVFAAMFVTEASRFIIGEEKLKIDCAIEAYRKWALVWASSTRSRSTSQPAYSTIGILNNFLCRTLLRHPLDELLEIVLRSPPNDWPASPFHANTSHVSDIFEYSLPPNYGGNSGSQIVQIYAWAASVGRSLDLRDEVMSMTSAERLVSELWDICPEAFSLATNAACFRMLLRDCGALPRWHQRLIRPSSAANSEAK